jgi:hypothetical protein
MLTASSLAALVARDQRRGRHARAFEASEAQPLDARHPHSRQRKIGAVAGA